MSQLLIALALLIQATFSPVAHDIECRQAPYQDGYVVEYLLGEYLPEDLVEEYLGIDHLLEYQADDTTIVIGTSSKGCR